MLEEQAELFQKMKYIEVDMSMTRLEGHVNEEINFSCQYFLHGKIKPFYLKGYDCSTYSNT